MSLPPSSPALSPSLQTATQQETRHGNLHRPEAEDMSNPYMAHVGPIQGAGPETNPLQITDVRGSCKALRMLVPYLTLCSLQVESAAPDMNTKDANRSAWTEFLLDKSHQNPNFVSDNNVRLAPLYYNHSMRFPGPG